MAKETDKKAGTLKTAKKTGGLSSGFFAEEKGFDRRILLKVGAWGTTAVGAVILAVLSNQSVLGWRREQVAVADLSQEARQIQSLVQESQKETRRLASAVETLNNDRDRLFSRVTVLEQGLDSVTGTLLTKQNSPTAARSSSPAPQASPEPQASAAPPAPTAPQTVAAASPPPVAASVTTVATALPALEKPRADVAKPDTPSAAAANAMASANMPAPNSPAPPPAAAASLVAKSTPPDAAAPKPAEPAKQADAKASDAKPADTKAPDAKEVDADAAAPASTPVPSPSPSPEEIASASPESPGEQDTTGAVKVSVQKTDFAVDLGSANSIGGLRALWRGLVRSNADLAALKPIIVLKEGNTGLGMQLHLAAGPLSDAAAAATICATLATSNRNCETTVFDGQRLAMKTEEKQPLPEAKKLPGVKAPITKTGAPRLAKKDEPTKAEPPSFSSLFKR